MGLGVQIGELGHRLSLNAWITVDLVVTSIMESGASSATTYSIREFRYNTVMIKFSGYYILWLGRTQQGVLQLIG